MAKEISIPRTQSAPPVVPENQQMNISLPPIESSEKTTPHSSPKKEIKVTALPTTPVASVRTNVDPITPVQQKQQMTPTVPAFISKEAAHNIPHFYPVYPAPPAHSPHVPPFAPFFRPYPAYSFIPPTSPAVPSPTTLTPRTKKVLAIVDPNTGEAINLNATATAFVPSAAKKEVKEEAKVEVKEEKPIEPPVIVKSESPKEVESIPPVLVTPEKSESKYPEGIVAPGSKVNGRIVYTKEFLLQFMELCNTKAEDFVIEIDDKSRRGSSKNLSRASSQNSLRFENSRNDSKSRSGSFGGGRGGGRQGSKSGLRDKRGSSQISLLPEEIVPLTMSENRWKRPSNKDATDALLLKLTGILNKLTFEKFDVLTNQILDIKIEANDTLEEFVTILFEKVLDEPNFSSLYAALCARLMESLRTEEEKDQQPLAKIPAFRKYLLNYCQKEFQAKTAWSKERLAEESGNSPAMAPKKSGDLTEEDYRRIKLKRRGLGLVRFIGEMFKSGLLSEKIMHECIKDLLSNMANPEEEEMESLCKLLTTTGQTLDRPENKVVMEEYFEKINELTKHQKLNSRVKFALMDLVDLRKGGWRGKNDLNVPKTISEIHRDLAMKEKQSKLAVRSSSQRSAASSASSQRGSPSADEWKSKSATRSDSRGKVILKRAVEETVKPLPAKTVNKFEMLMGDEKKTDDEHEAVASDDNEAVAQTKDAAERSSKNLLEEYLGHLDLKASLSYLTECIQPSNYSVFVCVASSLAFEKKKKEIDRIGNLFRFFIEEEVLTQEHFEEGFKDNYEMLEDLAIDIPNVFEYAGILLGHLCFSGLFTLQDCIDKFLSFLSSHAQLNVIATILLTYQEFAGSIQAAIFVQESGVDLKAIAGSSEKLSTMIERKNLSFLNYKEAIESTLPKLIADMKIDDCIEIRKNILSGTVSFPYLKQILNPLWSFVFEKNDVKLASSFKPFIASLIDGDEQMTVDVLNSYSSYLIEQKKQSDDLSSKIFRALQEDDFFIPEAYKQWMEQAEKSILELALNKN